MKKKKEEKKKFSEKSDQRFGASVYRATQNALYAFNEQRE